MGVFAPSEVGIIIFLDHLRFCGYCLSPGHFLGSQQDRRRRGERSSDDFISHIQASCRMGTDCLEHSPVSPFLSGVRGACFHPQCLWCNGYRCVRGIIENLCTGDDERCSVSGDLWRNDYRYRNGIVLKVVVPPDNRFAARLLHKYLPVTMGRAC